MSQYTFNIADYRPLSIVRAKSDSHTRAKARGFVVLTTRHENERQFDYQAQERAPSLAALGVADIRSFRESRWGHRYSTQLLPLSSGPKVIQFGNGSVSRVQAVNNESSDLPPAA